MIDVKTLAIAKRYTDEKPVLLLLLPPSTTSNYDDLKNKPSINGKELTGDVSSDEIGDSYSRERLEKINSLKEDIVSQEHNIIVKQF